MSDRTIVVTRGMRELLKLYAPRNGRLGEIIFRDNRPKILIRLVATSPSRWDGVEVARELRLTIRAALARPGLSEKTCERLRVDLNAIDEFLDTPVVDRVAGLA